MALSRSEQMARIRGRDTRPEMRLRRALWSVGLRYRLHYRTPAGRPDIVFPGPKVAVFVDGCQWHGCPLHYVRPRTRPDFWGSKLKENVDRDRRQTAELKRLGWKVVRVWEHQVFEDLEQAAGLVNGLVRGSRQAPQPDWRVVSVQPLNESGSMERQYLEDIATPDQSMEIERPRSTKKWAKRSHSSA